MKGFKKFTYIFLIVISICLTSFFIVTIFNNISLQKNFPQPGIAVISSHKSPVFKNSLKILSYNIRFATGVNNSKINNIDKNLFKEKIDKIAKVLMYANADIVFLQEVDIDAFRSFRINQGKYLAEIAGYKYCAFSTYWYRRIFPDINGRHGFLNHGLCILSKYPLVNQKTKVFNLPKKIPFFLRWLFNPHGAQKVDAKLGSKKITLINLHLDPWSSLERESQIKTVLKSVQSSNLPIIIGGDLNVELNKLSSFKNEQTIKLLNKEKFKSSISSADYLNNPEKYYTYPSLKPKTKLDYIFTNQKFEIIASTIINKFNDASDHLPILVFLKLSP